MVASYMGQVYKAEQAQRRKTYKERKRIKAEQAMGTEAGLVAQLLRGAAQKTARER